MKSKKQGIKIKKWLFEVNKKSSPKELYNAAIIFANELADIIENITPETISKLPFQP